jgi:hypothetical protein
MDDYIEARFDVIEKVTQVDDSGRPNGDRIYFKSLKTRTDNAGDFDDASCVGTAIDVAQWPDDTINREDGQAIDPDELKLLKLMYPKQDPTSMTNDDVFDPAKDVNVGDTWKVPSDVLSKHLQSEGLVLPDNSVDFTITLAGRRTVNGTDCLVVDFTVNCPYVDGDSALPEEFRSVHAKFTDSGEFILPVDPSKPVMAFKDDRKTVYTAGLVKDDVTVDVKGHHDDYSELEFVKAL